MVDHVLVVVVESAQLLGHPGQTFFGHHELQLGITLEDPSEDQVPEAASRVEMDFVHQRRAFGRVEPEIRSARTHVLVDGHPQFLAQLPDRVVATRPEALQRMVGRDPGNQHRRHAVLVTPTDVIERFVDVEQEDLDWRLPPSRQLRGEIDRPTVVGANASHPPFVVGLIAGLVRKRRSRREERRHRIGEQHLRADPLCVEDLLAQRAVPTTTELRGRLIRSIRRTPPVFRRPRPRVELVVPARVEVLAVSLHVVARVHVGRNHQVARVGRPARCLEIACHFRLLSGRPTRRHQCCRCCRCCRVSSSALRFHDLAGIRVHLLAVAVVRRHFGER